MRNKNEYVSVSIHKELYDRIIKDRDEMHQVIMGGKGVWSISDTIQEYLKIISSYEDGSRKVKRRT